MKIRLKGLIDTKRLGKIIAQNLSGGEIIFLSGDLGSGKTTLTKEIAARIGVKEIVNSPTFTLVKEYQSGRLQLIHLDLYRLKSLSEEDAEMVDEYHDDHNVMIIEWGEALLNDYPEAIVIEFKEIAGDERLVEVGNVTPSLIDELADNF